MSGIPHLLALIVFLPLAGTFLLFFLGSRPAAARAVALAVGLAELALTLIITAAPPSAPPGASPGYFLWTDLPWIERYGIRFLLGMDGISLAMCVLTAFITVIGMLVSWRSIKEKVTLHYVLLLAMETGIMGVFLSLDLFLFYLFWEVMLIPMFVLIGIWGHGRRVYSAVKFFIYTMAGSLLMLLAIIAIYLLHGSQTGNYSFALPDLLGTQVPEPLSLWLFAAFLLAFAIKFPLFPVHTWLPDAHTDAPTAGSVILAGLLLKTGAYGLLRFGFPLFPEAAQTLTPVMVILALIGIIYASWVAYAQEDLKRLVAYSSVGHMGFVALGIAAWTPISLSGSVLQMVNHGITTGALFAMVGMLDERAETREIAAFGGLWNKIPIYAFFFLLFSMASAGIPGLNNFAGEFLIVVGSFRAIPMAAVIAVIGIILPLVYTVRVIQEVLFVSERRPLALSDVNPRELLLLLALAALDIWLGVHPGPVLDLLHEPVRLLTMGGA